MRPLDAFNEHRIILAVLHYFSERYREPITIPGLSRQLGISLVHIETAFDIHKGKTTNQALLEYRLNRLCDQMFRNPSEEIGTQINQCGLAAGLSSGLAAFQRTNRQFIACFGIDLVGYHQQCFVAEATRQRRKSSCGSPSSQDVVGSNPQETMLMTRFHRPC